MSPVVGAAARRTDNSADKTAAEGSMRGASGEQLTSEAITATMKDEAALKS